MVRSLFLAALLASVTACSAQAQSSLAEQYLLSALNQERFTHSLPLLISEPALAAAARSHAGQMVRHGSISHQFPDEEDLSGRGARAGARFSRITENVAEGPSSVGLHTAWMQSAGHRANILDPGVTVVGIAVISKGPQLYAVEDFAHVVDNLTLTQQETAVGLLLDRAGIDLLPDAIMEARRVCIARSGYVGDDQPSLIFRYTTSDLAELPRQFLQQLSTGKQRHAAVGACQLPRSGPFASYNIAILLYP